MMGKDQSFLQFFETVENLQCFLQFFETVENLQY